MKEYLLNSNKKIAAFRSQFSHITRNVHYHVYRITDNVQIFAEVLYISGDNPNYSVLIELIESEDLANFIIAKGILDNG